ncbi:MAG: GAF domain-containing protein [Rhodospirillum sp.]|nr:GAF domain-containing protein [Rhodospirillum sp.]MCF8491005.1 GAF domain-containing protein [Rhodospirillum sp.]MCF8499476.1 GAF domain-containing protein [Rhodospirillum sp.]
MDLGLHERERNVQRDVTEILESGITDPVALRAALSRLNGEYGLLIEREGEQVILRTAELAAERSKLASLVEQGIALSAEKDLGALMGRIISSAMGLTHADGGTLYLRTPENTLRFVIVHNGTLNVHLGEGEEAEISFPDVPLYLSDGEPNHQNVVSHAVLRERTINIADAYDDGDFDFTGTRAFDERAGYRSTSFLTVPLKPRGGEVIGALQLINSLDQKTGEAIPFSEDFTGFVEAVASLGATALANRDLVEAQKDLLNGFIKLIAGAIDAKSPYTGGHCERVPVLAEMLARVATEAEDGPFADFAFTTEEEWGEFHIAAWLHDCGKVTTPEFVVDKATKLETIYNRIHEIRMRFEVLLRDEEILALRKLLAGNHSTDQVMDSLDRRKKRLADDFAFVAECNVGAEFLSEEKIERLNRIAELTWSRTLDDRLGLSHLEEERKRAAEPVAPTLPVKEALLADKPEHRVPRPLGKREAPFGANPHNFRMDVPEYEYDFGELHNLGIRAGTLSPEERFKINGHIIQTIDMLGKLKFPKHLARVPEYAGSHHETMIGTGYPRKLVREEMSVPARIMAIADIFEALTASDRPYKKAKTLSEAIRIMGFMVKDQHIDPDLFRLFLAKGIHRDYADRYLSPDQIDEVDVTPHLAG